LRHRPGKAGPEARLSRSTLAALVIGETALAAAMAAGAVTGEGAPILGELLAHLDRFDFWFEIVAP
jgi:alkyl sulfatase BDS1-like metallo-beta-lactamase superfamily hydrolase